MADLSQQIADLSRQIADLEARLGEVSGQCAELRTIMTPFLARYTQQIEPYQARLVLIQRELADLRAARGDRDAAAPGSAASPLDQFLVEDTSVQEQYERVWHSKEVPRPTGPLHLTEASPEIKKLYATIIAHIHPALTDGRRERERRRNLMQNIDEAYVRRDKLTLEAAAMSYEERSNLPAVVDDRVEARLRDRVFLLETALSRLEGEFYDLRYGLAARIKAHAEHLWKTEGRDLVRELSAELQIALRHAEAELSDIQAGR